MSQDDLAQSTPFTGASSVNIDERVTVFLRAVYGWMCAGLAITAGTAWFVASSPALLNAIVAHHIHFINKQYVEMQQWYMKVFDATLRQGQTDFFIGADLPGVGYSLNFFRWEGDQTITHVPTRGRVVDHVGFEVKHLEEFCKKLEAKGIVLTVPYRKVPGMDNMANAFITDRWGTSIELTEGLDRERAQ